MELKEFVVSALRDITDAVKECQESIGNGAIFAPTNTKASNIINSKNGDLAVSEISFDVAVTASSQSTDGLSGKGGINVMGFSLGAKGENENKATEASTSRIRFSIPVVYPPTEVDKKPRTRVAY
ncbi:MAG: hypothetical protein HDS80_05770 [Bacteroidales bacterium]|nr:hypothetical protein [Bacteroidales bacterium]